MKLLEKRAFAFRSNGSCVEDRVQYSERISALRGSEYPMLKGTTYLDHAGTTLPCKTMIETFSQQMRTLLLANPHSATSSSPSTSQCIVDDARLKVLKLFNADPEHFEVVFVANATAAIKLVLEAFRGYKQGFNYFYHRDSHTSLVGVRELAHQSHCFLSDVEVDNWLDGRQPTTFSDSVDTERPNLFAYPAQSNMNGRRLPLSWFSHLRASPRHKNSYTLLDVAALVSTSPLDLSNHDTVPDFIALSFYKIFGFPDLGALIVRKSAAHVFDHRKYFGGGTTEMVTCADEPWFARKEKSLSARLEDGTGAIRSILALNLAIDIHQKLFGGLREVSKHTGYLAKQLYDKLIEIKHGNGQRVCEIYKDPNSTYGDAKTQGGTIAFNICKSDGSWVSGWQVGAMAAERNIHIRTGSLCNPAGMAQALGLTDDDVQRAYASGFRCGQEHDVRNGVPMGMVRVSFGAMSTLDDVDVFAKFIQECFVDNTNSVSQGPPRTENVGDNIKEKKCLRYSGLSIDSSIGKSPSIRAWNGKNLWRAVKSCFTMKHDR